MGPRETKTMDAARGSNTFFTFLSRNQARQRGRPLFGKPTLDLVTTAPAFCFWLLSPDRSAPLHNLPRRPETGPGDRVYVKRRPSPRAALTPCACPNSPKAVQFPLHPIRRRLPEGIVMFQMTEKRLCSVCESSSSRNPQADGRSATTHHTKRRSFMKRS